MKLVRRRKDVFRNQVQRQKHPRERKNRQDVANGELFFLRRRDQVVIEQTFQKQIKQAAKR
jgi:hypothetical protein